MIISGFSGANVRSESDHPSNRRISINPMDNPIWFIVSDSFFLLLLDYRWRNQVTEKKSRTIYYYFIFRNTLITLLIELFFDFILYTL